jgi:hypothetical protein
MNAATPAAERRAQAIRCEGRAQAIIVPRADDFTVGLEHESDAE